MSGGDMESGDLQRRIDELAAEVEANRDVIAELRAEGRASHERAEQLEQALVNSRTIGTAIGIVIASRGVDREAAFAVLSNLSQETNRKVSDVADELVLSAEAGN